MPYSALLSNLPPSLAAPLQNLLAIGGPVMLVLLVMALVGLATFLYLMLFGALYAPRLSAGLRSALSQWQAGPERAIPDRLRRLRPRFLPTNPLAELVTTTMDAWLSTPGARTVQAVAARDAERLLTPFEAPLKILEVVAALAPLLGLLGTVLGMMEAFSAMAATEGRASASQLSGGIYEALTTTAAGLVVAIPFAAAAAWVEFRLRRLHSTLNQVLTTVLEVHPEAVAAAAECRAGEDTIPAPVTAPTPERATERRQPLAHATG